MKRVVFPRLALPDPTRLDSVERALTERGPTLAVDTANWFKPKVMPKVALYAGYDAGHLYLHFKVEEDGVMALAGCDHGTVWKDSCVELFCSPAADGLYYNLEVNCIGKALMACGTSRETSRRLPLESVALVKRLSTLGDRPFPERTGGVAWALTVVVPLAAFARHRLGDPKGTTWRANFYKCGDELADTHLLSWNPVDQAEPDFHRPEHFGELVFG